MRVVLQRVSSASVTIGGEVTARIGAGLLVLVGIESADTPTDGEWLAGKISKLRLFDDTDGKMNLSLPDLPALSAELSAGPVTALVVSQFTLHASTAKGTRPSFHAAARPAQARPLYELFIKQLEQALARPVLTGQFGAMMDVAIINNGPVTLILDSKSRV
ncbi:MAG: D-aminoacyl-tRNA deacylase [Lacunisphaera sp.]